MNTRMVRLKSIARASGIVLSAMNRKDHAPQRETLQVALRLLTRAKSACQAGDILAVNVSLNLANDILAVVNQQVAA